MVSWDDPPFQLTVILPLRESVPAFAATVKLTVAESLPDPVTTVMKLESEVAVQPHEPEVRVTTVVPEPPPATTDCDVIDKV
jgi:hypothetical protein